MFKYDGAKCPVCNSYLMEEDDIVVCPECGAPHHRDCWNYLGHCGCEELHKKGESWQGPKDSSNYKSEDTQSHSQSEQGVICPVCHEKNPPNTLFCNRCGNPLMQQEARTSNQTPFGGMPPMNGFGFSPVSIDPLGGLQADEIIDDVSAKDLAAIVGQNSAYYLPRFKAIQENPKKKIPNFSAFIFSVPWLFFRRMYLPGIAMLLANVALYLPNFFMILYGVQNPDAVQIPSIYLWASMGCTLIMWALQLVLCFWGNQIYMKYCIRLTKELKKQAASDQEFSELAQKRGGVRNVFIYIFVGLYLISSFSSFFFYI